MARCLRRRSRLGSQLPHSVRGVLMRPARVVCVAWVVVLATGCDGPVVGNRADTVGCASDGARVAVCPGRGLYDAPVDVEIVAPKVVTPIYYTLDGTAPSAEAGIKYSGPVTITGTQERGVVVLRATSFAHGSLPSPTVTHSFVFPDHVVAQPAAPDGFPAVWGVGDNTLDGDYEMDPDVVGNAVAARDGLAALPTLSLVMDAADLFGPIAEIYMNPEQGGATWERPASAELIFPDGSAGFAIECGVRIQGAYSARNWNAAKLSLRLLFKRDYGYAELEAPVFADSHVTSFDTLVLDAHFNFTWIMNNPDQRPFAQYVRDAYTSDLQIAVGSLAPHSRFVHLYLNGLYWGIYDVHERPDESFAATYLGGTKSEYDVIRNSLATILEVKAGNLAAWNVMVELARGGLADPASYQAFQQYLDVDDFIDYLLVNFYVGNDDWPHNNWYAARRRVDGAGFRFFNWDAEYVLLWVNRDRTGVDCRPPCASDGPGELYLALLANADFRASLVARAEALLDAGVTLDPENAAALYRKRLDEVDAAILLESARWGDNRRADEPYMRADWLAERDRLLDTFFPKRSSVVLSQVRTLAPG